MRAIAVIRKEVLKLSQKEMADLTGVSQATVSRWETGELEPGRAEMLRIRDAAKEKDPNWSDARFFDPTDIPRPAPAEGVA